MGVMPGHIAKGVILEKFDAYINASRLNLQAALAEYKSGASFAKVIDWGQQTAGVLNAGDVTHVLKHWFPEHSVGPGNPYWATLRPLSHVFRKGLIQALELCELDPDTNVARPSALPLDSYWICTQTHFEMCATIGSVPSPTPGAKPVGHHVNLLILTPNPPIARHEAPPGGYTGLEDIWIVQHSDIEPGSVPIGAPSGGHVVTVRLQK